ncbi:MAG: tyrosine-type recombinase/integrase [Pirellulales bacterium]
MLRKVTSSKPEKPYKDFPLTAHRNGQWCKKIRGKLRYFGKWDDWQAALDLYEEQRDDLQRGRKPQAKGGLTLAKLMDKFLYDKQQLVESGELSQRSYDDYERTCDKVAASLDKTLLLTQLGPEDFSTLRTGLAKGTKGKNGPSTLKGHLTRARMIFNYANESGLAEKPILYRKALKAPNAKIFRQLNNERGERMFSAEEIRRMIDKAEQPLKAMIYLGINCGFGNNDCGTLPFGAIDLDNGWHNYARPKTGNKRRCPLWPETIEAVREAIDARPEPNCAANERLVFITKYGHRWSNAESERDNPISFEFRKLMIELGMYRKGITTYYSLRRTFETIGASCGEQVAVDMIMGHCPESTDMAAVYRQKTFDKPLLKVSNHVRDWLQGRVTLD